MHNIHFYDIVVLRFCERHWYDLIVRHSKTAEWKIAKTRNFQINGVGLLAG